MDIFESLENLNVSEECFDEIMGLVEALISEDRYVDTKTRKLTPEVEKSANAMIAKIKPQERHLKKERRGAINQYRKSYNDAEHAKQEVKKAEDNLSTMRKHASSVEDMDKAMDKVDGAETWQYYSELDRDRKNKNLQNKMQAYNKKRFALTDLRNLAKKAKSQNQ